MKSLKPNINSVAFHHHGKELAVVLDGDNLWFCHKINIPTIKTEADNVSCRSIQFNYIPHDKNDIPKGSDTVLVRLHSHFANPKRNTVEAKEQVNWYILFMCKVMLI